MADKTVQLTVSFETLLDAITKLSPQDKYRLWELLDEQIDEALDDDPATRAEIEAARAEVEAGDYVTWDEYKARRTGEKS